MKKLDDYKRKEAYYEGENIEEFIDDEGCHWSSAESFIQGKLLGFCCCGDPESNLLYVLKGLEIINTPYKTEQPDEYFQEWIKIKNKKEIDHFVTENAKMFFYYWLDKEEFTEHGSGLSGGGWLTDKGKELLAILTEFKNQYADKAND